MTASELLTTLTLAGLQPCTMGWTVHRKDTNSTPLTRLESFWLNLNFNTIDMNSQAVMCYFDSLVGNKTGII